MPIEVLSFAAGGRSFLQPVNFDSGTVWSGDGGARFHRELVADVARSFGRREPHPDTRSA